jgi:hypothetical protein
MCLKIELKNKKILTLSEESIANCLRVGINNID